VESHEHNSRESQEGWVKLIATGFLSVAITAAGAVAVSWRDLGVLRADLGILNRQIDAVTTEIRQVDNTLRIIAKQAAENSIHRVEHEKQADRWIAQILENEAAIHELIRVPAKRADPFTGTQGRELEERIKQLESHR
jgi:hypothetical protein